MTDKADKSLCITCQCNLKKTTISQYNISEQIVLSALNINETGGAGAWQSCSAIPVVLPITQEERDMGTALGAIEDLFECSGWCNAMPQYNLIYHFSNINKGRPKGYCYNLLEDAVDKYANVVGSGALITFGFLLLISLINICICCHPSRKGLSFQKRFVYMKDGEYSRI